MRLGRMATAMAVALKAAQGAGPKIFAYDRLGLDKAELIGALHDDGYIVVRGVPGYVKAYEEYLVAAGDFAALSEDEQAKCTPAVGSNNSGWSRGIEKFNGVVDTYKGSYYASVPDRATNLWPETTGYREKYLGLAQVIRSVGLEVLSIISLPIDEYGTLARGLDYAAVPRDAEDVSGNWCGKHHDHGAFTGICAAAYYDSATGARVDEPAEAGLVVRGRKANIPADCLGFQVGEVAQIVSNDKVTATEHWVTRAPGVHRRTMAVFFFPADFSTVLHSETKAFGGRYRKGMTWGEWHMDSLNRYVV